MVLRRPGFIVPNATEAGANLDLAEPDALDFNLLGNYNYGVITDCAVTVSGASNTVAVRPGVAVVNGLVVKTGGSVILPTPSQTPRFDLITVDTAGTVGFIQGIPSPNPVFPDYPTTVTVLASVMIRPTGGYPQDTDVIDKRIMLATHFVTALGNGSPVLSNQDPSTLATLFSIGSDGTIRWAGDTYMERQSAGVVHISNDLAVRDIAANRDVTVGRNLTATGDLASDNFRQAVGNPAGTATNGDLYKNLTDGSIWAYQAGWKQMSTVGIPAGMTMMGMMTTAPLGWLPVNGQTVNKATAGGLWDALPQWQTGPDAYTLPDARDRHFAYGTPGTKFGQQTAQFSLQVANLPAHKHLATPTAAASGAHGHTVSQTAAGAHQHTTGQMQGAHTHDIYDPGHTHPPPYGYGGYVMTDMQGTNKLDGLFNDASHTYSVTPIRDTGSATDAYGHGTTGIQTTTAGSNHVHTTDQQGVHTHGFSIDSGGSTHTHPITENSVGNNTPFDIRPPSIGMFLYIKT